MNATTTRLSSSLRQRSAEESLEIAASIAPSRGVSRVVDTTWLDHIGVPVFASIRPDGLPGSVCVHAGKGFTSAEAKIGAYMEAIEFSFAAPGRNRVPWSLATPIDILESFKGRVGFTEFAPRLGSRVEAGDRIAVCEGDEILGGLGPVRVPAELVYHPFHDVPGIRLYGTSTNGLASGNTLDEATVHALAEVMERHVRSFELIDDRSVLVDLGHAPDKVRALADRIAAAGLRCTLRYCANEFGMAYFSAYLLERDEHAPIAVATGHGFHPISEIAAVRALAEAVQSRLSFIHGGRDDLLKRTRLGEAVGRESELRAVRALFQIAQRAAGRIGFDAVPTFDDVVRTVDEAKACLFEGLQRAGMQHAVRLTLTEPDYPFQVVKLIVPGAETYEHLARRVGPRLLRYFEK